MNSPEPPRTDSDPRPGHGLGAFVRSWRYFFILLAFTGVILLFYAEETWRGDYQWQRYERKLLVRGEKLDLESNLPPPVPDSENFAMTPLLAPLFQFWPGGQKWRDTNAMSRVQNFAPRFDAAARMYKPPKQAGSNSWIKAPIDLQLWCGGLLATNKSGDQTAFTLATNLTVAEAAAEVLLALAECRPVLDELREASRRKYSRFDLQYHEENPGAILLPHLASLKHFCQVLQLKASAELALGRTDEAYEDVLLIFYLADAIRSEPIVISQLIRYSQTQLGLQVIAQGMTQWSDDQLRALQERLLAFDFCADMRTTLKAERVLFGNRVIDFVRRSPNRIDWVTGPSSSGMTPVLYYLMPSGWFSQEKVNYWRMVEQLLPGIDADQRLIRPQLIHQASGNVDRLLQSRSAALVFQHRSFAALILPSMAGVARKTAFAQTGVDLGALACALQRYRLAHGAFPTNLTALCPAYIAKLPHDIINGRDLQYRPDHGNGYLLYSIGWNERDDGGWCKPGDDPGQLSEGDWTWKPLNELLNQRISESFTNSLIR